MKHSFLRRITAYILTGSLLANMLTASAVAPTGDFADTETAVSPALVLEADRQISSDEHIDGMVESKNGAAIVVESGMLTIAEAAEIYCDILVTGRGALMIYGKVYGTVTVQATALPQTQKNQDIIEKTNTFTLVECGYVHELVYDTNIGFGAVNGVAELVRFTENFAAEVRLQGQVGELIYSGKEAGNCMTNGKVGSLRVLSGRVSAEQGSVDMAELHGGGLELGTECTMGTLVVREGAYAYTYGAVGALIVLGGDAELCGSSGFVYLGENSWLHARRGETGDGSIGHITAYYPRVLILDDVLVEAAFVYGDVEHIELKNTVVGSLTLDAPEETANLFFSAAKDVVVLEAVVSAAVYEQYRHFEEELGIPLTIADLVRDRAAPAGLTLLQGDVLQVTWQSGEVPSGALVHGPDGVIGAVFGDGETSFFAEKAGTYTVEPLEGAYGARLSVSRQSSTVLTLNTYTAYSEPAGMTVELMEEPIVRFALAFFDEATGAPLENAILRPGDNRLLLPEEYLGRTIRVEAVHDSARWGNLWGFAPSAMTVNVGEQAEAEIVCYSYTKYQGWIEDATDARVYIYDADGYLTATANMSAESFWTDPLADGEYTAVFIRDAAGLYRYAHISDYERNGLRESEHYLTDSFTAAAGVGAGVGCDGVDIPAAPPRDFRHVDSSITSYSAGSSVAASGGLYEFVLNYRFLPEHLAEISNARLSLQFSAECELLDNSSMLVNGVQTPVTTGTRKTVTIPIPPTDTISTVSYTVTSSASEVQLLSTATLTYDYRGQQVTLPVGSAAVQLVTLSISSPTAVSSDTVALRGYAPPGETVSIYDGALLVASAVVRDNGYWSLDAPLISTEEAEHKLKAVVYDGTTGAYWGEVKTVSRYPFAPEVEEFSLYYYVHGHEGKITVSGDDWGKTPFHYEYWPGSIFTFEVSLTNSEYLSRVWVVSTIDGSYHALEAAYDEASGLWIAAGRFSENELYMPGEFVVEYKYIDDTIIGNQYELLDFDLDFEPLTEEEFYEDCMTISDAVTLETIEEYSEGGASFFSYAVHGPEGQDTGIVMDVALETVEVDIDGLEDEGYVRLEEGGSVIFARISTSGGSLFYEMIVPRQNMTAVMPMSLVVPMSANRKKTDCDKLWVEFGYSVPNGDYDPEVAAYEILSEISVLAKPEYLKLKKEQQQKNIDHLIGLLQAEMEVIRDYRTRAKTQTQRSAADIKRALCDEAVSALYECKTALDNDYKGGLVKTGYLALVDKAVGKVGKIVGGAVGEVAGGLVGYMSKSLFGTYAGEKLKEASGKLMSEFDASGMLKQASEMTNRALSYPLPPLDDEEEDDNNDDDQDQDDGNKDGDTGGGGEPIPDPSGYVYEAVYSNRLSGVTTRVYYENAQGNPVLWRAEDYGQQNPLLTGGDGRYEWFVPRGLWQVEYSKDGYEPAKSEWLEVPPPRMNVNQALTSLRTPSVAGVMVTAAYAEITFDKYMDIASVSGAVAVTDAGGKALSGTVEARNAEDGAGGTYATVFRVNFTGDSALVGEEYHVQVAETALCYAGIPAEAQTLTATAKSTPLELTVALGAHYASGTEVVVPVTLGVIGHAADFVLEADVVRGDLATITDISAFDEKGNASITLRTEKAGATGLVVTVAGTALAVTERLVVARESDVKLIAAAEPTSDEPDRLWIIAIAGAGVVVVILAVLAVRVIRRRK